MPSFVLQDSKGKFAVLEWSSQGRLPFNLMTTAPLIFNASSGEFIKNRHNITEADIPHPSTLVAAKPVVYTWPGIGECLIGFDNKETEFSVTLNDLVQSKPTYRSVDLSPLEMRVLKARPTKADFSVVYDRHDMRIKDFNIEGTRTGRTLSSTLLPQGLSQKPQRGSDEDQSS